ncbi:hypothetical protein [Rhodococcus pyridinivorans]|uniref:hypothetical protein n=1 Tax=Rhodococcus pyridinivorans TaxID=103816 RepID=UPI002659E898|nr:hypothetical protein [Rhodococcus pyridinivorans]
MWDLDASSFADVRHAAKLCATKCARIVECRADLNRLVSTGDAPRSQVMAAQTFSKHGKQLETEIAILGHMNSVAAGHEGNKNAVSEPAAQEQTDQDARVYEMRRTLKALDSEVETDAGTQFALDLGA